MYMYLIALSVALASTGLPAMQSADVAVAPTKPAVVSRELQSHPDWPKAKPDDVKTIRAIVGAFFDAISAPAGGTLDRERLRALFVPDGRIEIPQPASKGSPTDVIFLTPDQYADNSDSQTAKTGFFDHVLAIQVQHFGVMAHVYTSYESRKSPSDLKPFVRGVKSIELLNSAGRWYIVQVSWDREGPGNAIPDRYLHDADL
jgi:hypothetical protein